MNLSPSAAPTRRRPPAIRSTAADGVDRLVARTYGVAVSELRAPGRPSARVGRARHVAMYLHRVFLQASCEAIGRHFRHHRTSVSHACHKVEDMRDDPAFDAAVARLERRLEATLAGRRG